MREKSKSGIPRKSFHFNHTAGKAYTQVILQSIRQALWQEWSVSMKVVGINGSPRANGNTSIIIKTVFAELEKEGIETELIQLGGSVIPGCKDCGACVSTRNGRCIMDHDVINEIITKSAQADGIILGSPLYYAGITPEMKAFIERVGRVCAANNNFFKHKLGAAIMPVRRGGAIYAFDTMNHFLHYMQMYIVGARYWNMVYEPGAVERDDEGIENMRVLGENMAWLLKKVTA